MKFLATRILLFLISTQLAFADSYVWEDYDDFSGSALDTSKWGAIYLGGGTEPYVEDGKLVLEGNTGNPSATKIVKAGWEDVFTGDDGGQAWVYATDSNIFGIEAEFMIPLSANSKSGLQLGVASLNPLSYATVELNADPGSSSQYSQGFGFYHLSGGVELENFATTSRGISHTLSTTIIDEKIKLYVDGSLSYSADTGAFNIDMFFLNAFNDYQSAGLPFTLNADNVRVLRRAVTTSLDGSVFQLFSTDGVSETLSFENGVFTSTFVDPEEGTFVDTDKSYTLDQVSDDIFKIILDEGDTFEFNEALGTGSLVDYENGVIDTEGTWSFTFERHDWEDYDDFSSGSLDTEKWDVWWGAGGELPIVTNGALKLSGTGNESYPASSVIPDDLTYTSNLPSKHSVALINQDDIYGMQAEFMIPSNPSDDTGLNFIFFDWAGDGSKQEFGPELEYRSESGLRTEFAWTDPHTGEDEQITRPAEFATYYKMSLIHTDSTNSMYLNGELIKEFSSAGFSPDTIGFAAFNDDGLPYATYVKNVRVLRRSQKTTEPDPVTVVSDPNGNPVVVQVGDEYQWNSTLDGVTLWSVDESGGDIQPITMRFENGRNFGNEGFYDSVAQPQPYDMPFVIDENGYIKVTEDSGYQYYHVVSVENGVIATLEGDEQGVIDDGVSEADQWFFTTRAAAEEYYYAKVNPKNWMWFDHYPWVYSQEEQGWLYFYPSGGKLLYWSNQGQAWREFN
jgi:hypothetical protein